MGEPAHRVGVAAIVGVSRAAPPAPTPPREDPMSLLMLPAEALRRGEDASHRVSRPVPRGARVLSLALLGCLLLALLGAVAGP
jgi:hypothetical protein